MLALIFLVLLALLGIGYFLPWWVSLLLILLLAAWAMAADINRS